MRLLIATGIAFLALTGTASAVDTAPPPEWEAIAAAMYPGGECTGLTTIRLVAHDEITADTGNPLAAGDAPLHGRSTGCVATIEDDLGPVWTCTAYLHELGHLNGLEHSLDPDSVMNAEPTQAAVCAETTAAPTPVETLTATRAVARVRVLRPMPWRIACRASADAGSFDCWATLRVTHRRSWTRVRTYEVGRLGPYGSFYAKRW